MANTFNICSKLQDIADAITQGGGGGGTTVIANPVGTPTADLDTVQIGQVIYDIPGSGGGGGTSYTCTNLYYCGGTTVGFGNIQLNSDMLNYDDIEIVIGYIASSDTASIAFRFNAQYFTTKFPYVAGDSNANPHALLEIWNNNGFACSVGASGTDSLRTWARNGVSGVVAVNGLKYGRSAGASDAVDVTYDNTASGLSATNVQDAIDEVNTNVETNATDISTLNSNLTQVDTSVTGIICTKTGTIASVLLNASGNNVTISADGKTLNQIIPTSFRPQRLMKLSGKVYNGSSYIDCGISIQDNGKIEITDDYGGAITGISLPFIRPTILVYQIT